MAEGKKSIRLSEIVRGILEALLQAKHFGDKKSAQYCELYKENEILSSFPVPIFSIAEMEIDLRFSVVSTDKKNGIMVNIDTETLGKLENHCISTAKLKFLPKKIMVAQSQANEET